MSSGESSEIDLRKLVAVQAAIEYLLTDILTRLYLTEDDPTQVASNHRATLRAELSTEGRIPPLRPDAEEMARMIADAVDGMVEKSGREACRITETSIATQE
jgi:hypothetical protein